MYVKPENFFPSEDILNCSQRRKTKQGSIYHIQDRVSWGSLLRVFTLNTVKMIILIEKCAKNRTTKPKKEEYGQ